MTISRRQLYAFGETLGECVTRKEAGRIVCGGGSGGGGTSTTQQNIPDELKPLATKYASDAINLSNQQWQGYGGQRYADMNTTQNLGIGMIQDRALNGSQTIGNAENALNQNIMGGQTNPYLDSLVSKAQGSVADQFNNMTKPQTESAMANSGSFGNAGLNQLMQNQQKAAGQQMGDIASQMYGSAYETDKKRQMQSIGMAPQFGNMAYQDAGQLINAGNMQQDQAQQGLDFNYSQFQDWQNDPYKKLAAMSGVFGSFPGQSSTTTSSGGGK